MNLGIVPVSSEHASFHATLSQVGPFLVLLDCGWQEDLDPNVLGPLMPYLGLIDIVLLSKASIQHLGAYPFIFSKLREDCVVLCTEPVRQLGEIACLSLVEELEKYRDVEAMDTDAILRAFLDSRLHSLKYTETFMRHTPENRGLDIPLAVTPYQAGGGIGAAYWILQLGSSQMVYCSDFSLRDTRHCGGMDFQRILDPPDLQTPTVLVTSLAPVRSNVPHIGNSRTPASANMVSTAGSSSRVCLTCGEAYFLEKTVEALRDGGSVIVPMDVVGTALDALMLLDEAWSVDSSLMDKFPVCWVSCYGDIALDQVKTRLEFMSKRVQRMFEDRPDKKNPFVLSNIRMYPSISDMHMHVLPRQPKVVLATFPSMEHGDARELLFGMAKDPQNLLWLTLPWYPEGSLAAHVFEDFVINKASEREYHVNQNVKLPLAETQLKAFYDEKIEEERVKKDQKTKPHTSTMEANAKIDVTIDMTEIGGMKTRVAPGTAQKSLEVTLHPKAADTFFEPQGWQGKTFIHSDLRKEVDDYGQILTKKEIEAWQAASEDAAGGEPGNVGESKPSRKVDSKKHMKEEVAYYSLDENPNEKNWLHDLRIRFGEPMRCEVRKKVVKVACKVLYCSFNAHDHRDTRALIMKMRPQQVVVLPTTVECEYEALQSTRVPIHFLSTPLTLPWRPLKRRAFFDKDLWEKLAFQKLECGSKVCSVTAIPGQDPNVLEGVDTEEHNDTLLVSLPKLALMRTSLKKIMPSSDITFQDVTKAAVLDLNGRVRLGIRNNSVRLEGGVSEEFYTARTTLYEKCIAV